MNLQGLRFVMLGAGDVDRCVAFYRDTLGLPLSGRFGDFAFFDTGATTLALSGELATNAEYVFGANSVNETYSALRERGVVFVNEPRPVNDANWAVSFRDPQGHLLSIYGAR
jgi:catechol 2,3-dioxygenase-like lactoylglutathione lyase family enzyme